MYEKKSFGTWSNTEKILCWGLRLLKPPSLGGLHPPPCTQLGSAWTLLCLWGGLTYFHIKLHRNRLNYYLESFDITFSINFKYFDELLMIYQYKFMIGILAQNRYLYISELKIYNSTPYIPVFFH